MKFIHAADIHLDSPLRGLPTYEGAAIERIRTATRDAFINLVDFAIAQRVELLLIAGDLYDGDWKNHNTGLFFVNQLVRLRDAGVRTFLIRGNHDAANRMTHDIRLPENCDGSAPLLSHESAQSIVLPDLQVAIHGRGFGESAEFGNFVDTYPAPVPGMLNIGLLHTSLSGAEGHEPYAPCSIEQLIAKDYQYWALGHIHKRAVLPEDRGPSTPWIVYSGNLQGRHIRETGPKGCMLLEAQGSRVVSAQFQALDVVRWSVVEVDASDVSEIADLERTIRLQIEEAGRAAQGRMLAARVVVTGATPLHFELISRGEKWTNQVRSLAMQSSGADVWVEKVVVKTAEPQQAVEVHDGPLSEIAAYIQELKRDNRAIAQVMEEFNGLRRKLPDQLLESEELRSLYDVESMRDLLDEVEPLLIGELKGAGE